MMDFKSYQAFRDKTGHFSSKEQAELDEKFRFDALIATGLLDHPKANELYLYAWKNGWEGGHEEVFEHLCTLADMIFDNKINA